MNRIKNTKRVSSPPFDLYEDELAERGNRVVMKSEVTEHCQGSLKDSLETKLQVYLDPVEQSGFNSLSEPALLRFSQISDHIAEYSAELAEYQSRSAAGQLYKRRPKGVEKEQRINAFIVHSSIAPLTLKLD